METIIFLSLKFVLCTSILLFIKINLQTLIKRIVIVNSTVDTQKVLVLAEGCENIQNDDHLKEFYTNLFQFKPGPISGGFCLKILGKSPGKSETIHLEEIPKAIDETHVRKSLPIESDFINVQVFRTKLVWFRVWLSFFQ